MMKTGWWYVKFDLTLEGEEVRWDDLDEVTQEHIAECIKEGYTSGEIVIEDEDEDEECYYEAVETCPHCDEENVYPMWDVSTQGYIAVCKHCGKEIFLCDECMHSEDNPYMNCNWCKIECGGKCFRGITKD